MRDKQDGMKGYTKRQGPRRKRSKTKSVEKPSEVTPKKISKPNSVENKKRGTKSTVPAKTKAEVIFQPNPGPQTDFLSASEQEVLYGGAAGGGKVVLEGQSVLTPTGFVEVHDLKEGMVICDPKGGTQKIVQLHPWEEGNKWEVELDDGTVYPTRGGHLWSYWLSRNGPNRSVVRSTEEMLAHTQRTKKTAILPTPDTVYLESSEVELDPYFLGVLLGDGCLTTKQISFTSHEDDQEEYLSHLNLPETDVRLKGQTIRFVGKTREHLAEFFETEKLLGCKSNSKFIPSKYLWNSESTRLSLLQGLMDTDGYRDPGRARAEFASVSEKLVEGAKFLAQSLGYRVSVYEKVGSYKTREGEKVLCQKAYRLYITGQDIDKIFRLQRKKTGVVGKQLGRRIVDIRETGERVKGRCITVSSEHSLYISDDFVVTHNSYAMLADPLRFTLNPDFRGILFRRTNDELRELKSVSKSMYPRAIPEARWSERDSQWNFPGGASLWMTYLDKDDDVLRYQGQAFNWIGFDELTQWPTPYAWNYMRSRLRTTSTSGLKLYQRATSNPGGPGHAWVKKMFIDPAPWGEAFDATDIETGETLTWPKGHSKEGQPLFKRRFIPANLFDNPYLAEDGTYEANLLSLSERQRKQLLEGDWDVAEGAAFTEFNRAIHVVEPFKIPPSWIKFRACDYGYGSQSAVLWFAVNPSTEQLIVYRELYVSKVIAVDLADMILQDEGDERISYGMLDSSLWHQRGDTGPSIAEQMIKRGCRWTPSDRSKGSRVAGKNELHRRLQVDEYTEEPRIVFFNTCTNLISELPIIPLDKKNPEDVDTKITNDHGYDALRYGIMSRPQRSLWDWSTSNTKRYRPVDATFGY